MYEQSANEVYDVLSINIKDIPIFLHNSEFYENLNEEENLRIDSKHFLRDLNINGSDNLLLLINTINYWNPRDNDLYFLLFDFCYDNGTILIPLLQQIKNKYDIPFIEDLIFLSSQNNSICIHEKSYMYLKNTSGKIFDWFLNKFNDDTYSFHRILKGILLSNKILNDSHIKLYFTDLTSHLFIFLLFNNRNLLNYKREQIINVFKKLFDNCERENSIILSKIVQLRNLELLDIIHKSKNEISSLSIFDNYYFNIIINESPIDIKKNLLKYFDNDFFINRTYVEPYSGSKGIIGQHFGYIEVEHKIGDQKIKIGLNYGSYIFKFY